MDYITIETTIKGPGISDEDWNDEFEGCNCENECSIESACSCLPEKANNYSDDFRILAPSSTRLLIECSDNCSCSLLPTPCRNRVVQNGIKKKIEIFSTRDKGSGVRAEELIGAGEFVCEYAGECIGEEEVERRCKEFEGKDNYTLTLREHFGDRIVKTFIDPRLHGNIGRFLNHSCDPNCEIVIVRLGKMIPIAAIFAKRDIESGEELCYDYGVSGIEGPNRKPCHCKSATCRKYLPMSATPIE
ncbi:CBN-SET-23 protein [Caenorhabditis brenneri]|uniref:CBN-SET-23 protein n=1 Tax=Caenorhabditis brenneri TaxID=135651 RepID=G0N6J3_CAEBE|nr:CBN-SET-23 protein [Caenorhabditis brenneri]